MGCTAGRKINIILRSAMSCYIPPLDKEIKEERGLYQDRKGFALAG